MQYRTLGRTNLRVSTLSFGAAPLGNMYGNYPFSDNAQAVAHALDGGINLFDTAPYYGAGLSEETLGKCLKAVPQPRDAYHIATKVGRYGANDFDFSAARVRKSVDESLARLQCEYIDIIQCHDIEFADLEVVMHEAIPALRECVAAGKARFINVTGLQLGALMRVARESDTDGILSYCRHTLANSDLAAHLPELAASNRFVCNASPLAMGLLSSNAPPEWHPAGSELRAAVARAVEIARTHNTTIETLALQFSTSDSRIATTFVGMADRETVARNLEALDSTPDPDALAAVRAVFAPFAGKIWPSGLKSNHDPQVSIQS